MSAIDQLTFLFLRIPAFFIFLLYAANLGIWFLSRDNDSYLLTAISVVTFLGTAAWKYAVGRTAGNEAHNRNIHITGYEYFGAICLAAVSIGLLNKLLPYYISLTDYAPALSFLSFINAGNLTTVLAAASLFQAVLTAKALVCVEEGKNATFSDYFPTLFMLVVPVIGVWFIQSRVRMIGRVA